MAGPNITNITRRDQRRRNRQRAAASPTTTTTTKRAVTEDAEVELPRLPIIPSNGPSYRGQRIGVEVRPDPRLLKDPTFIKIFNQIINKGTSIKEIREAQKEKGKITNWPTWEATIRAHPMYIKEKKRQQENRQELRRAVEQEVKETQRAKKDERRLREKEAERAGAKKRVAEAKKERRDLDRLKRFREKEAERAEAKKRVAEARRKKARSERMKGIDTQRSRRKSGGLIKSYTSRTPKRIK